MTNVLCHLMRVCPPTNLWDPISRLVWVVWWVWAAHGNSNVLHWRIGGRLWWELEVFACVPWSTEVPCGASEVSPGKEEMATPRLQRWGGGWALRCPTGPAQHCRSRSHRTRPGSKTREKFLYTIHIRWWLFLFFIFFWLELKTFLQGNPPRWQC